MDFQWYTSIGGIIAATIILVEILKRWAGNVPVLSRIPTWLIAVTIAALLTAASNLWWHTLPGNTWDLIMQAVLPAAVASGFWEWIRNVDKPLSASTAARVARGEDVIR